MSLEGTVSHTKTWGWELGGIPHRGHSMTKAWSGDLVLHVPGTGSRSGVLKMRLRDLQAFQVVT